MRLASELKVLRLRGFRLLFGASLASLIGDGVVPVALAFAVLDLTGSATDLGVVLACRTLALLGALLAGGVVADRLGRRGVMVAADLVRLLGQGAIGLLLVGGVATVAELAISQALLGAASGFFAPAGTALLADVAGPNLREANALRGIAMAASNIVGPAIAGALVLAAGPGAALLIDAASYAVSALLLSGLNVARARAQAGAEHAQRPVSTHDPTLWSMPHAPPPPTTPGLSTLAAPDLPSLPATPGPPAPSAPRAPSVAVAAGPPAPSVPRAPSVAVGGPARARRFFAELREGFAEVRSRTWLWSGLLVFSLINTVAAAFPVLGPLVAKQELGGAGAWAAIMAARATGGLLGGAALLRLSPRRPLVVGTLACTLTAVPTMLLAIPAPLAVLLAVTLLAGLGPTVFNTLWETTLLSHVPEQARSRVSSYDWFGSLALQPLGLALIGPLAGAIGVSAALLSCGALEWALGASLLAVREVRTLPARPSPAGATLPVG